MRKNTIVLQGLVPILLAAAMAVPAAAVPANPAWPDSHATAYLGVHIDEVNPQQVSTLKLANSKGAVIT
ncbi:MAG: hypothetical protein WCC92_17185, partial [Candidatus Korobacteraceae bacterium]